jgi:hypothetical protein
MRRVTAWILITLFPATALAVADSAPSPHTMPVAVAKPESAARLDDAWREVRAAAVALELAHQRLAAGRAAAQHERVDVAGPAAMPDEAHLARVETLAVDVAAAEVRLQQAWRSIQEARR